MFADSSDDGKSGCDPGRRQAASRRVRISCGLVIGIVLVGVVGRAMLHHPDPAELYARAVTLMDREPDEAERLLRHAVELTDGSLPCATAELCVLQLRKGDWEAARQLMAGLDPEACEDRALLEFARHARRNGHSDLAVTALDVVRRRTPRLRLTALELLTQIYQERHQDRELLDCVRETALSMQSEPAVWWQLLELTDARQLSAESVDCLRLALSQQLPARDRLEMQHQLVARFVAQGQIGEARKTLDQLPKSEQSSARTLRHLAAICRLEGKPQLALEALQSSQSMVLEHPGVAWLRGQIRFDLEKYTEAIEDFEIVLKADPFDLTVHLRAAEALRRTNQTEAAHRHEEAARDIREKRQQINRLREAARRQPDNRTVMLQLAGLYRQLNDQRAADYWQNRGTGSTPATRP